MQVMHVVNPGMVGGLERVVQTLAAEQRAAGDDVHVAAVVGPEDADNANNFFGPLRSAGVDTHAVELPPRRYLRERAALIDICRRHRPAIVHTHGYRADLVDGGVAHAVDAASVTTIHGFTGGSAKNRCYEWLHRRAIRRFDAVVAVSRPLALQLVESGVPADRLHLVLNAWRPAAPPLARGGARDSLGIARNAFVIGWVGRVSHEKGLDVLIDAMASLRDLPIYLSVIGDGPARQSLEARARRRDVAERVMWHGFIPDADRLLGAFNVFVLSSRTEGSPMVLLEALATGVPIVATRVGGVPDLLRADEGSLVPPECPDAIADGVRHVFRNQEAEIARARAAQRRVAGSDRVGPWISSYDAVYQAAMARACAR